MIDTRTHELQQHDSQGSEDSDQSADEWDMKNESGSDDNQISTTEFDLSKRIVAQTATSTFSNLLLDPATLDTKIKNWRNTQKKRFSERKKFGYVDAQKELLPPEVLR